MYLRRWLRVSSERVTGSINHARVFSHLFGEKTMGTLMGSYVRFILILRRDCEMLNRVTRYRC